MVISFISLNKPKINEFFAVTLGNDYFTTEQITECKNVHEKYNFLRHLAN